MKKSLANALHDVSEIISVIKSIDEMSVDGGGTKQIVKL